ncbi:MAG: hypothetical protein HY556_05935 [Euryarchaeota archaeon]|nr:hypothetical protein [Euryarchaeota archaeon]
MPNLTVSVPDDLKDQMSRHDEVNWSAVVRRAIEDHLRKLEIADAIAQKSRLTRDDVEELDRLVKKGISKRHGLS